MLETQSIENKIERDQYRLGLFICVVIYAPFGLITEKFLNNGFDTFLIRLPVDLLSLVALIASFKLDFAKRNLRFLFLICTMAIEYQYFGFFAKSNQHFFYTIGITLTPVLVFMLLYRIQDIIFAYIYFIVISLINLMGTNLLYFLTYSTMLVLIILVYYVTIRNRNSLLASMRELIEKVKADQLHIESKNKSLTNIGELAAQVAHDIRSPVSALQAISETLQDIDPKKRQLIEKSATRINQIADYLISEYRTNISSDMSMKNVMRSTYINEAIQEIVDENKAILRTNATIEINSVEMIRVPEYLNLVEFKRVLSNLLNNSIEALDKAESKITIVISKTSTDIKIVITDNGVGIPIDQLPHILEKGVTFKSTGSGLGLSHASTFLKGISGTIEVESIPGKETSVFITLPV